MKIKHTNSPNTEDIYFLRDKIREEIAEYRSTEPFGFFIRNEAGEIIYGCNGYITLGAFTSIHTNQLWVHPCNRKQGLASMLMEKVHQYGRLKECSIATVITMSFQSAITLYKKLGYKIDLKRKDNIHGASCFFLRKDL
jgi:GNAT superfamily N-acetyltransferase